MFTYATIPKHTMGRKWKKLSPEEKRVFINIFESGKFYNLNKQIV